MHNETFWAEKLFSIRSDHITFFALRKLLALDRSKNITFIRQSFRWWKRVIWVTTVLCVVGMHKIPFIWRCIVRTNDAPSVLHQQFQCFLNSKKSVWSLFWHLSLKNYKKQPKTEKYSLWINCALLDLCLCLCRSNPKILWSSSPNRAKGFFSISDWHAAGPSSLSTVQEETGTLSSGPTNKLQLHLLLQTYKHNCQQLLKSSITMRGFSQLKK